MVHKFRGIYCHLGDDNFYPNYHLVLDQKNPLLPLSTLLVDCSRKLVVYAVSPKVIVLMI